ncbi:uncharacterized protein L199_005324 [Kwoniella botswanensis]|uniref:uncharacterized protein n=1 Tax=Kwoniella botswanensis TaxID=1268659 RepID=UPI00315CB356
MSLAPSDYDHTHDAHLTFGVSKAILDTVKNTITFNLDSIKPARSNQVLSDDVRNLMDQLQIPCLYRVITEVGDDTEIFSSIEPTDRTQIKHRKTAKFPSVFGSAHFVEHLTRLTGREGHKPQTFTAAIFGGTDEAPGDTVRSELGSMYGTSSTKTFPIFTPGTMTEAPSIRDFEDDRSDGATTPTTGQPELLELPRSGHANITITSTPIRYPRDLYPVFRIDSIEKADQLSARYNHDASALLLERELSGKTVNLMKEYSQDGRDMTGKTALQVVATRDSAPSRELYNYHIDSKSESAWRKLGTKDQSSITMEVHFRERVNGKDNFTWTPAPEDFGPYGIGR